MEQKCDYRNVLGEPCGEIATHGSKCAKHAHVICAWPNCRKGAIGDCEFDGVTRMFTRPICDENHTFLVH